MSEPQPSNHRPRRSACAETALLAELARVTRMTVEERINSALTMRDRFDWLTPEEETRLSAEK